MYIASINSLSVVSYVLLLTCSVSNYFSKVQLDCSQHWHKVQLKVNLALNKGESGRVTKEERTRGIRCEKKAARQMRRGRNENPKGETSTLKTPLPQGNRR